MFQKLRPVIIAVLVAMLAVVPVFAVTNGEPDGDGHPYVGVMVAFGESENADGETEYGPLWRCTGTLMSDSVFLTAGHCTEDPADHVEIWFYSKQAEILANGWPFVGQASGVPQTHSEYNPNAFYLYDLGVVLLDEPYAMDEYGQLPSEGVLDNYQGKDKKAALTAVGYGLQAINPVFIENDLDRLRATLDILNTKGVFGVPNGTSVAVSGSGVFGDASDSGGTCFGDSGGPQFLTGTNTVVAVTSFGINGNCAGTGGGYRVDQADDLSWLANFLP